jgi:hypothetical protein
MIDCAEISLYTPLSHKINETCVVKYMGDYFKLPEKDKAQQTARGCSQAPMTQSDKPPGRNQQKQEALERVMQRIFFSIILFKHTFLNGVSFSGNVH